MKENMVNVVGQPIWVPFDDAMKILAYIRNHPTWWLNHGVRFKYISTRVDARTSDMIFFE